jgi:hypothetical protein
VLARTAIAVAALVALGEPAVSNDGQWALQWGHQLAHGQLPDFGEARVSTPHPLTNLLATLLAPLGFDVASWAWEWIMLAA